jgi:subtilase family serine protease
MWRSYALYVASVQYSVAQDMLSCTFTSDTRLLFLLLLFSYTAHITTGYDSTVYMERVNVELQKLAVMGVTVIVAAGDDGSSGFGIQCPIDAKLPVDISGSRAHSITCPFDDKADCKCAR